MKNYEELKIYYRIAMGLAADAPVSNKDIDSLSKKDSIKEAEKELERDQKEIDRIKSHTMKLLKIS